MQNEVEKTFRLWFRLTSVKREKGRKEGWVGRASDYSAAPRKPELGQWQSPEQRRPIRRVPHWVGMVCSSTPACSSLPEADTREDLGLA